MSLLKRRKPLVKDSPKAEPVKEVEVEEEVVEQPHVVTRQEAFTPGVNLREAPKLPSLDD